VSRVCRIGGQRFVEDEIGELLAVVSSQILPSRPRGPEFVDELAFGKHRREFSGPLGFVSVVGNHAAAKNDSPLALHLDHLVVDRLHHQARRIPRPHVVERMNPKIEDAPVSVAKRSVDTADEGGPFDGAHRVAPACKQIGDREPAEVRADHQGIAVLSRLGRFLFSIRQGLGHALCHNRSISTSVG